MNATPHAPAVFQATGHHVGRAATRRVVCACMALACALATPCGSVFAQQQVTPPVNVPLPPRRPQSLPALAAPEPQTNSEAPTSPQQAAEPSDAPPTPTRAQLRACSLEWQKMKKSGAAAGLIWRDFAKSCIPDH